MHVSCHVLAAGRIRQLCLAFVIILLALPAFASRLDDDLIYRVTFGRSEDVEILLSQGASANAKNELGISVLSIAIDRNDEDSGQIVSHLIESGAAVDEKDSKGEYPLLAAIKRQNYEAARLLVEAGADIYTKTAGGITAMDLARKVGGEKIKTLMENFERDLNAKLESGRTQANLTKLLGRYAELVCARSYLEAFMESPQGEGRKGEISGKISAYAKQLTKMDVLLKRMFFLETKDTGIIRGNTNKRMREQVAAGGLKMDVKGFCAGIANFWTAPKFLRVNNGLGIDTEKRIYRYKKIEEE